MDDSFPQQEAEAQKVSWFSNTRRTIGQILKWLVNLALLTEEEQQDAGIHLDHRPMNNADVFLKDKEN